jgi:16S rRNA (cytosine1402-N4)-methyltransferase
VGIDADFEAIEYSSNILGKFKNKVLRQFFFDQLDIALHETNNYPVDGILFDLGLSSYQLNNIHRGFSFQKNAPLDMRYNQNQKLTAEDVLNKYSLEDLQKIIRDYGEESNWKRISYAIARKRKMIRFQFTKDLAEIVHEVVGERRLLKSLAKVFQAIRIEVNKELERLKKSLQVAFNYLKEGGRIVVISYHSLEDRITKEFFKYKARDCVCPDNLPVCACDKVAEIILLTPKAVFPSEMEIQQNPRSRSARLRAAEKIVPFVER